MERIFTDNFLKNRFYKTGLLRAFLAILLILTSVIAYPKPPNKKLSDSGSLKEENQAGGPTVAITQAGGQLDPSNATTINFTATFSEAVSNFINSDVTLGGTAGATTVV